MFERMHKADLAVVVGMLAWCAASSEAWGQTGACCIPGPPERCQDLMTQVDCEDLNGVYMGNDTECATVTCPQWGACCDSDGLCTFATEAECIASGGSYQGDDSSCGTTYCPVFGACCVRGQCTDSVEKLDCWFGDPDGGCFYKAMSCSVVICSEVEILLLPDEALLQENDVIQVGIVVRSTSGVAEQFSVMQVLFEWDETQFELLPPAIENTAAYDWLVFGLPGGGVGGPLNSDFTDGDAYLEATPQVDLGNQPIATPSGLLVGWVEFKAVGVSQQSQITIPLEAEGLGGATLHTLVLDSNCDPPVAGLNILVNVGSFTARVDCNGNDVDDAVDISGGTSSDCNQNTTPDECEISVDSTAPPGPWYCTHDCNPDCNDNGVPDDCDIDPTDPDENGEVSEDCQNDGDGNGIPDECETDCNCNSIPDPCDIDCEAVCDVPGCETTDCSLPGCGGSTDSLDCGTGEPGEQPIVNGVPDECDVETDCNENGRPDVCDVTPLPNGFGDSPDYNFNGIPDECEGPELCGDISANGVVNVFDALCLLSCIEDPENPSFNCEGPGCTFADVDPCGGNGVLSVFDIFAILAGVDCMWTEDPYCCCTPP